MGVSAYVVNACVFCS